MKHIKIIFLYAFSLILVVSCNKNLSQPIGDTQSTSSVTSTLDVLKVLQGTYGIFQNNNMYKEGLLKLILMCADDFTSSSNQFQIYCQHVYNSASPDIESAYAGYYSVINNCNFIIASLPTIKTSSGTDSTLKVKEDGETRFFRAFSYFDLVRLFGAIPVRTQPTDYNTNFYTTRQSVDSVYSLIFSDLKIASSELNYQSVSDGIGLTNKGAVTALQALAFITYANYLDRTGSDGHAFYKSADSCCNIVIKSGGYSLVPNYADLWNVQNESNNYGSEVIFGMRFTRDRSVASTNSQGSGYASRFTPSTMGGVCGNTTKNINGDLGSGAGTYKLEPWFYNYYTTGNYLLEYQTPNSRSSATFLTQWPRKLGSTSLYVTYPNLPSYSKDTLLANQQFPFIQKYVDAKGLDAADNENDMFILRLSEMYLIQSEAENELSTGSGSYFSSRIFGFNKVRQRAGNPVLATTAISKDAFRKMIFDERGLEFVGECKRWFDMVRMKGSDSSGTLYPTMYQYQYSKYLTSIPTGLPFIDKVNQAWITSTPGGLIDPACIVPFNSKFLLFPIPQSERDENPALTQNLGW